jgi:hypothetical protein
VGPRTGLDDVERKKSAVQPLASLYTDYAILPPYDTLIGSELLVPSLGS